MPYESEVAELLEGFESEGISEWGEAARRTSAPRTASGRGLAPPPPPSKNYVAMSDLRAALEKVGTQIKTNSDAIASVSAKLNATTVTLKKEFEARKKEGETARKDTNQKVSMLALLPLLIQPPTYTIPQGSVSANVPPAPVQLPPPATSMMNALLPVLLVGGLGTGGPGGSEGGMDNTMLLVLALVLANPARS